MRNNQPEKNADACRARALGKSNLVECLKEEACCHWHIPFGNGRLCGHPSNQQIVKGVMPMSWSPTMPDAA
jgi:hypothetical protein